MLRFKAQVGSRDKTNTSSNNSAKTFISPWCMIVMHEELIEISMLVFHFAASESGLEFL